MAIILIPLIIATTEIICWWFNIDRDWPHKRMLVRIRQIWSKI